MQLLKDTPNSAYDYIIMEFMYQNNRLESQGFSYKEIRKIVHDLKITGTHNIYNTHMVLNLKDVFEYMIDTLEQPINGDMLLTMHNILMDKTWEDQHGFKAKWKQLPNCIIGSDVDFSKPEDVEQDLKELIEHWTASDKTLDDIIEYHVQFERIHPFQYGNGIIGRLLMLKQCIENEQDILIVDEGHVSEYLHGLYVAQMCHDDAEIKVVLRKSQQVTEDMLPDLKHTLDSVEWDRVLADSMHMK